MGSLTVRNIGEEVKRRLRVRAARNGRSMEEEIRHILASADAPGSRAPDADEAPAPAPRAAKRSSEPAAKRVLLIIGGGIAAYKSLDLIRRLQERGAAVRVVMTKAAQEFITPLSAGALAGEAAFTDLIVVAPATADLVAKMANGLADDLASTVLLATDKPVLIAPAMNPRMWEHAATRRNVAQLRADGILAVGPNAGEMAERGEAGTGRMAEPIEIADAAMAMLGPRARPLSGKHVLITSGPTHEPIDPVRYIANRSSGKQGFAIARAAAEAGAKVTLISGPVSLPDPTGVKVVHVDSARAMLAAAQAALPADVAIFAAAVADWRVAEAGQQKIKKGPGGAPHLTLVENPDILATVAKLKSKRPKLVIGFAAETERVVEQAKAKLKRKGSDWILANDVSSESGVMGGDRNKVHLISARGVDHWPEQSKDEVAHMLIERIAAAL
jgi:phosphopantothenoylcysteine decarboxylase/phosphopantothenate--cysteine ligase